MGQLRDKLWDLLKIKKNWAVWIPVYQLHANLKL